MTRRAAPLAVALGVGLLYTALLAWAVPLNGLWSGDQGAKLLQVVSLIQHRLQSGAIGYPGGGLDPAGAFSPLPALYTIPRGDEAYSIFSYPYAALTVPWFFLLGYAGLYVVPVLATVGTLALGAALGARLGVRQPWVIPLALGLTTPLGFYALVFWEHALATSLATGALLSAALALGDGAGAPPRIRPYALLAGLLAGLAWWFRAECLWLGPALLLGLGAAGAGRRALAWAAVGLALGLLPAAAFNMLIFGLPLGPQVAVNFATPGAATPAALLAGRGAVAATMLLVGADGLWWPAAAAACALASAWAGRWRPLLIGAAALVCLSYLVGPGAGRLHTGLIVACPLALLALPACRPASQGRPQLWLPLGAAAVFIAGVLLSAPNDGGAQWGPRYLLPVIPALVVAGLAGALSPAPAGRGARAAQGLAVALLAGAGLLAQLQGLQTLRDTAATSLRLVQVVNAQPDQPVLTDIWYGPQLLAPLYFERTVMLLHSPADLAKLSATLRAQRITRFSYLTVRPWGRDTHLPPQSGADCTRVEGLGYGLTLLDCVATP